MGISKSIKMPEVRSTSYNRNVFRSIRLRGCRRAIAVSIYDDGTRGYHVIDGTGQIVALLHRSQQPNYHLYSLSNVHWS